MINFNLVCRGLVQQKSAALVTTISPYYETALVMSTSVLKSTPTAVLLDYHQVSNRVSSGLSPLQLVLKFAHRVMNACFSPGVRCCAADELC